MKHLLIAFIGCALVLSHQAIAQESLQPPAAIDVVRQPEVRGMALAPDGKHFSLVGTITEKLCVDLYGRIDSKKGKNCREDKQEYRTRSYIAIFDFATGERKNSFALQDNVLVDWAAWANSDRLVFGARVPNSRGQNNRRFAEGSARIATFSLKDPEIKTLFSELKNATRRRRSVQISQIANLLPTDPDHIVIPANVGGNLDIWKVNVNTGDAELLSKGAARTIGWGTDIPGNPTLRLDCVGEKCYKVQVHVRNASSGEWELKREFENDPLSLENAFDFAPIAPTSDPNTYVVVSSEKEFPRAAIKTYNLETNEYVDTLFEHPVYDVTSGFVNPILGTYEGAFYTADVIEYDFENPVLQERIDGMISAFGGTANVLIEGMDWTGNRSIIKVTSPVSPGEYFLFDAAKRELRYFTAANAALEAFTPTLESEIHRITVRDGLEITAYQHHPSSGKNSDAPMVVMPHGGPEARDVFDFDPWVFFLTTRGYQVVQMNFRGSEGYGREFVEAGHGEAGGTMQDDVTDVVKWFHETGRAPADRTCIFGYSYGGYVALLGTAKTPELYKCAIGGGGVYDIAMQLGETRQDFGFKSELLEYWTTWFGDPRNAQERELIKSRSPAFFADDINVPVLLMHGEWDQIVKFEQAERMRAALRKAGNDPSYLKLEEEGHNGWSSENRVLFVETLGAFLEEHLPVNE